MTAQKYVEQCTDRNFYSLVSIAHIKSEYMLRNTTYQDAHIREHIKKAPGACRMGQSRARD